MTTCIGLFTFIQSTFFCRSRQQLLVRSPSTLSFFSGLTSTIRVAEVLCAPIVTSCQIEKPLLISDVNYSRFAILRAQHPIAGIGQDRSWCSCAHVLCPYYRSFSWLCVKLTGPGQHLNLCLERLIFLTVLITFRPGPMVYSSIPLLASRHIAVSIDYDPSIWTSYSIYSTPCRQSCVCVHHLRSYICDYFLSDPVACRQRTSASGLTTFAYAF